MSSNQMDISVLIVVRLVCTTLDASQSARLTFGDSGGMDVIWE